MSNLESKNIDVRKLLLDAGLTFTGEQLSFPVNCKRVKLDVGLSFNAKQSMRWLKDDENLFVLGFEPVQASVNSIKALIQKEPDALDLQKRFVIIPVALGSENGVHRLFVTEGDAGTSSLLKPKKFAIEEITTTTVIRLDDVLKFFPWSKISKIDYLKTDCQGSDLEVLLGTSENLSRIAVVTAEADSSSYESSRNGIYQIRNFMESQGFKMINPRSKLRILVGNFLRYLPFADKVVKLLVPPVKNRVTNDKSSIIVDDPTFINPMYLADVQSGEITAFQRE